MIIRFISLDATRHSYENIIDTHLYFFIVTNFEYLNAKKE